MTSYPTGRGEFFGLKVVRLMFKSCAANAMGLDAVALVSCVAMVEDVKRYSGPVSYFTGQLLPVLGLSDWKQLDRIRKRAVSSGWLHYEKGRKGVAAKYWALIPDHAAGLDDTPTDESPTEYTDKCTCQSSGECGGESGDRNGVKVAVKAAIETGGKRGTTLPNPNPNPNPKKKAASPVVFPAELDEDGPRVALDGWLAYKRAAKHPYKVPEKSVPSLLKHWARFGAVAFCEAVEVAIGNGWRGLQDPKAWASGNGQQTTPKKTPLDIALEAMRNDS